MAVNQKKQQKSPRKQAKPVKQRSTDNDNENDDYTESY